MFFLILHPRSATVRHLRVQCRWHLRDRWRGPARVHALHPSWGGLWYEASWCGRIGRIARFFFDSSFVRQKISCCQIYATTGYYWYCSTSYHTILNCISKSNDLALLCVITGSVTPQVLNQLLLRTLDKSHWLLEKVRHMYPVECYHIMRFTC